MPRPLNDISGLMHCPRCDRTELTATFHVRKDGYRRTYCKECRAAYRKEYDARRRRDGSDFRERVIAQQRSCRSNNRLSRISHIHGMARFNAEARCINFDISKVDVLNLAERQMWRCAKTLIPFDLTMGKGRRPFSPSIDRIDNSRGYIVSNIQLVCSMYNQAKHIFSDAEVLKFARALVDAHSV